MKIINDPYLIWKFVRFLQKSKFKGGYWLQKKCKYLGLLNVKVRYRLNNNTFIDIPLYYRSYDLNDIIIYEEKSRKFIIKILSRYNEKFCLLDIGADIGLMSALLSSECSNINQIMAFEPNYNSYNFLKDNLALLNVVSKAENMAISDWSGKAKLILPEFDLTDHAAFIVPNINGEIDVMRIDDLNLPNVDNMLLKIDVEGEELPVIKGAYNTIKKAKNVVIIFEAHYRQVERTKIDPTYILSYLTDIRFFKLNVTEVPTKKINLSKPFFNQFPKNIFNICVYSEPK